MDSSLACRTQRVVQGFIKYFLFFFKYEPLTELAPCRLVIQIHIQAVCSLTPLLISLCVQDMELRLPTVLVTLTQTQSSMNIGKTFTENQDGLCLFLDLSWLKKYFLGIILLCFSRQKAETFRICLKKNFGEPHKISTQSANQQKK